jgi:phosphatidylcholine synthase
MDASVRERTLAWAVHLYTASGAVWALAALAATVGGDSRGAFLWMAVALFVDSTDGTLARAARVKEVVPQYDGSRLDDIVDYLNYVLVPVFFALMNGMLPATYALWIGAFPLIASAYGFCQAAAKTSDFFFTGFPSYWNIAIFYLYVLDMPPRVTAGVLIVLSVLVFVPIGYIYPSRTRSHRPLTLSLGALWGIAMLVALFELPRPSRWLVWGSLVFPIYYFALSFYLHSRRPVHIEPSPG